MQRLAISAALCFGLIAACGGTSGDDLLAGDGGGADADASIPSDGQSTDAPSADVLASDSSDGASCPDFCASVSPAPLFCSDFDGEASPTDWTVTVASGGGTVAIAPAQNASCPNGLHASVPAAAGGTTSGPIAIVAKDVPSQSAAHVVMDVDVYLPSNDTTSYVDFFGMRPTAEPATGAFVSHHGDAFWFVSSLGITNGGINVPINPAPLTGAWNHMTLDVHFGQGNAGSVMLKYTGNDNAQHVVSGNGTTATAAVTGGATAAAGMVVSGYTGSEAVFDAYYDNVVVRVGN